jgi:hypothetical protein
MNEKPDEVSFLPSEDDRFVGRLAEHYAPPALSAQRRAVLDAELRDRIATPRGLGFARPAFATAAVGLAIGLALVLGAFDSTLPVREQPGVVVVEAPSAATAQWESGLFGSDSFDDVDAGNDLEGLPDDYAAIAGIFLDG